jgi:predicted GNAT family acetyltransferase
MSTIRNNAALSRYELDVGDATALLNYRIADGVMTLVHTETPPEAQGQGVGSRLVKQALEDARAKGLKVVPRCPFANAYMGRHPEYNDLLV